MAEAKLTSKGQITIPKAVRKFLGISTGDKVDFSIDDGVVVLKSKKSSIMALNGIVKPRIKGVTLEDMKNAIGKGGEQDDRC